METRKVQLTGGSTYTISLPIQWAREHDIRTGEYLSLDPQADGSLVVRTDRNEGGRGDEEEGRRARAIRVNADHLSRTDVTRTVRALYAAGFDSVTLTASDGLETGARRAISTVAGSLIGLEVVEETERGVTLRSLLDATDVSIRQTVIQLQLVALSMQREATTALEERDTELATHVIERDDEADRLFGMVDRHFQRALSDLRAVERLGMSRPTLFRYYTTARNLERIADHAEKVAHIVTRLEAPPATGHVDAVVPFARRSHDVVEDAASVLLGGGDVDMAYGALVERDDLTADLEPFDRRLYRSDVPDAYLLGLVLDSVKRTAEYGGNVAEVAIQHASTESETTGREPSVGRPG